MTFNEAANLYANQMLSGCYAHSFYLIFRNFIVKLNENKDEPTKKVLVQLCVLTALTNFLDENWGEILDKSEYRLIKTAVNNLLREIRPNCVALVDAFDYPDHILKSTIGRYDGNVYEALYDAAQHSVLNKTEVFNGYEEVLKPHLDLDLLKRGNVPIEVKSSKF